MIKKEDVIKMLDEWLERLDESNVSEAIECVLLMVRNKVENMPESDAWITVSERSPDKGKRVLFTEKDTDNVDVGWCADVPDMGNGWFDGEGFSVEVSAWQQLPEAYKPKQPNWKDAVMQHFTKVE